MSLQPSAQTASTDPLAASVTNGEHAQTEPVPESETALPQARQRRRGFGLVVAAAILVLGAGGFGTWYQWFRGAQTRTDLVTFKVEYKNLQLKVVERGTLEAKENRDIKCDVKAGSRGAPKIKWVVDNGTLVNKGDPLVTIDDSALQEQADQKKIDRLNALKDRISAEQNYPVKKSELQKWIKGDFPQTLHDIEGKIQVNESNVLQQEDRTAWAARMVKKGYMTASQAEAEQANLMSNKLTLQSYQEAKKVLLEYTDPVNRQTFTANEQGARADMEKFQAIFEQQDKLYKDLLDQIKQCKIESQYSGIVVYAIPEQTRTGSGSSQSIIAQGEPVQYGQKLMSIPDLTHMLVNVRVHEAFINYMKEGLPVTVRVDALPGRILKAHVKYVANVAAAMDWMSPDVKVYQASVEIDEDLGELKLKPGLSAVCTIYTNQRAEHVLAVPVQTVVTPMDKGGRPRVFVLTPHGPEAREVELGLTDDKYVEIKNGIEEGDAVVLSPRSLVSDKEKKVNRDDDKTMPTGEQRSGKGKNRGAGKGKPGGDASPENRE
jgi:HlyD family secretion protein